jgi:hypothetical protein
MQYPTKVQNDWKAEQLGYESAREFGLRQIYSDSVFDVIPRSEANDAGIEDLCCEFLGTTASSLDEGGTRQYPLGYVAPSLSTFRSVVESDPNILKGKHRIYITSIDRQKVDLIYDVEELLKNAIPHTQPHVRKGCPMCTELTKLRYQSLEQVAARKQKIVESQRLVRLNTTDIRGELKAGRPAVGRYHPHKTLPPEISAGELKVILGSRDKAKFYAKEFGFVQLNDRLFGRG